ncbi:MAG: tartrate dehydrogenase [Bacteroidales bacterium]|nr:tartrate dehydrogenase [Bacteroidales bacterium]
MAKTYRITVIPGDGIGQEVTEQAIKVLRTISKLDRKINFDIMIASWGTEYYLEHGVVMPPDAIEILKGTDAILLGAVGDRRVPDNITVGNLVLTLRRSLDQYVNLRPVRRLPGVPCPLKEEKDVDMVFVRENIEGEYANVGGSVHCGSNHQVVMQTNVFTRWETERIMRYAFSLARKRRKKVTSVTKSNALKHSMVFWDDVFDQVAKDFPDVETNIVYADAMAVHLIKSPEIFDVIVASNLLGDILTDLASVLQGGLGLSPSANINPERLFPSMFEPVHGSAPELKGKNIANPIATIWAAALMLDHFGESLWCQRIIDAISGILVKGKMRTKDLGGTSTTVDIGQAITEEIERLWEIGLHAWNVY